jgi:putative PIN family toxin of toxin-antitoxin system
VRVVLDTNVIVSALIVTSSVPNVALRSVQSRLIEHVTSTPLLTELREVLLRPHIRNRLGWSDDEISAFVMGLREISLVVEPEQRLDVVADEADNRFVEAAVAGEAHYIVTGDLQLQALKSYEGIEIVTPARFVVLLSTLPA